MTVADTLRKAADLIDQHGHTTGEYRSPAGRIDTTEAIWVAATGGTISLSRNHPWGRHPWNPPFPDDCVTLAQHNAFRWAMITLQNHIRQVRPDLRNTNVAAWNDDTPTADITAALRRLADTDPGSQP